MRAVGAHAALWETRAAAKPELTEERAAWRSDAKWRAFLKDLDNRSYAAPRTRVIAIAMMCGAMVCFTGLDSSAKALGRVLPTIEVVWARYLVACVFALFVTRAFRRPRLLVAARPGLQALRSL